MNNNKALFFDIDGTLFSRKTKIIESTYKIIEELHYNSDIDIYISTGRGISTINEVESIKKFFNGLILTNGQSIYIDNINCYNNFINEELVKNFINYIMDNRYSIGIITPEHIYLEFFDKAAEDNFRTYCKAEFLPYHQLSAYNRITQFWLFVDNDVVDEMKKIFPDLEFLKWGKYGADIISKGSGKADGVKKVIEMMNYDFNNTYAFGDGENDVSMFKAVKYSIAMGNGCEMAKNSATYITDPIYEDGLSKAINKYVLEKEK